jgi:ATP-dependent DNA helicase RecG
MNILELISKGECEEIEFKSNMPKDLSKSICALANANGGYIIIGISDGKKIVGVDAEKIKEKVSASLSSLLPIPKIKMKEVEINNKTILVLKVEKSKDLVTSGGIAYIRIGRSVRTMNLNEILIKASEVGIVEFDEQISPLTLSNISADCLQWLIKSRKKRWLVGSWKKILSSLRLIKKQRLTFAGVLFLYKKPQEIYPHTRIRVMKNNEWTNIEGPFKDLVKRSLDILKSEIKFIVLERLGERIEIPTYSERAFRETIVNALVHRNYALASEIFIKIGDKIIIENPGSFPPGVSIEDPKPIPRNRWVYETAFQTGFVEKIGSGLEIIQNEAKKNPFFNVRFELDSNWTKVIFERSFESFGKDEEKVLLFLTKPRTSSEIAEFIGKSKPTVLNILKSLKNIGLVDCEGSGRWVKWFRKI